MPTMKLDAASCTLWGNACFPYQRLFSVTLPLLECHLPTPLILMSPPRPSSYSSLASVPALFATRLSFTGACELKTFCTPSVSELKCSSEYSWKNDEIHHVLSIYLSGIPTMRQRTCVICLIALWYTVLSCYISHFFDPEPAGALAYSRFQSLINLFRWAFGRLLHQ